jgi:hypothetical protein
MANYNQSTRARIADINRGMRVDRATATLPQTTASAIFNIVGYCAILGIIGEVTTVIQTQANNTKLTANPTTGTSVDLCTVLDITAKEVNGKFSISGLNTDAMIGGTAGRAVMCSTVPVVDTGTIDLDCAASNTGSVKWSIWYVPVEDGAYIEAA